jgi:hypothetical protein
LPPNVTTMMSGSRVDSNSRSRAGQLKKSGLARPDETLYSVSMSTTPSHWSATISRYGANVPASLSPMTSTRAGLSDVGGPERSASVVGGAVVVAATVVGPPVAVAGFVEPSLTTDAGGSSPDASFSDSDATPLTAPKTAIASTVATARRRTA